MRTQILGLSAIFVVTLAMMPGQASSHREAPLLAQDPMADNSDTYAFVSPDAPDTVTLIANFIPFQEARWRTELLFVRSQRGLRDPRRKQRGCG